MNVTLEEIESSLPNGFHDAEVKSLCVDYVERTITFEIRVWIGDVTSPDEQQRETYQNGVLTLEQFLLCVIEPPDAGYPYDKPQPLTIDSGSGNRQQVSFLETIPEAAFAHWFYVNEWNAFIYVIARGARLDLHDTEAA